MRSIGIMSMQRIFNYGSSLQALALKHLVENLDEQNQVSFLDFRPGPSLTPQKKRPSGVRSVQKVWEYSKVDASIANKLRFMNHKRSYANEYLPLVGVTPELNYSTAVDLQLIGSDEVFNCAQSNQNIGFSRDLFGHDSSAQRVATYAASFGNTTLEKMEMYGVSDLVRADLKALDRISVRDQNSASIVEFLTGKSPSIHLDPTLVHDFAVPSGVAPSSLPPYMIVYGYSGRFTREENATIRQFSKRNGLKVIAFGGLQSCADRFIDCGPLELLSYFAGAQAVVTDTFHGTIFAIINQVPFASLVRPSSKNGYGNEEKLGFLLKGLGLAGQCWKATRPLSELLEDSIDFSVSERIRQLERIRTHDYLKSLLIEN